MQSVDTGLPAVGAPFQWATKGGNILFTAQVPIRDDGSFETGDITAQTELTLANLDKTLRAAGGGLGDLTQVIVYLTDLEDMATVNEIYARVMPKPYPNRAALVVSALAVSGMRIELVAYAHLPS